MVFTDTTPTSATATATIMSLQTLAVCHYRIMLIAQLVSSLMTLILLNMNLTFFTVSVRMGPLQILLHKTAKVALCQLPWAS